MRLFVRILYDLITVPGNWLLPDPMHWCPGCCATRKDAVETSFDLASRLFFGGAICIPAENKWLSGYINCQDICLPQSFHGLLPYCEHHVNAKNGGSAKERKEMKLDDDYLITQDFDQTRAAYGRRAARFIHDPLTLAKMLFYIGITAPIMVLHYQYFCMGVKNEPSGSKPEMDKSPGSTFEFADREKSPASEAWAKISSFLFGGLYCDSTVSFWSLLIGCLGPYESWPDSLWWLFRSCLLDGVGGIFRRLIFVFLKLPWSDLCPMYDTRKPLQTRQRRGAEFLRYNKCCIDKGCSLKLRRKCKSSLARLFGPELSGFMIALLNSCIHASSSLECDFAAARQWLQLSPKPLSVATVAAKMLVHRCDHDHQAMIRLQERVSRKRPLWKTEQKKVTGLHLYSKRAVKEDDDDGTPWDKIQRAQTTFANLDDDTKASWRKRARSENHDSKHMLQVRLRSEIDDLEGACRESGMGYLGMGDRWHALSEQSLLEAGYYSPGFVKHMAGEWELSGVRVPNMASKRDKPTQRPSHCRSRWDVCMTELSVEDVAALHGVHEALERCILSIKGTAQFGQPCIRPRFEHGGSGFEDVWQVTSFAQARPGHYFTAEFIGMFQNANSELALQRERHGDHQGCMTRASEQLEQLWWSARTTHGRITGFEHFRLRRGSWFSYVGIDECIFWDLAVARQEASELAASQAACKLAASIATPKKTRREKPASSPLSGTKTRKVSTQRVAALMPEVVKKADLNLNWFVCILYL